MGWGGGYQQFYTGKRPPPSLTLLYTIFDRKGSSFVYHLSTKSISKGDLSCRAEPPGEKFCCVYTSSRDWSFLKSNSLHSKRFQSSYSGKVGERAKRLSNGEGEGSYSNLFYDLARNSLIFQQRLVGQIKSEAYVYHVYHHLSPRFFLSLVMMT